MFVLATLIAFQAVAPPTVAERLARGQAAVDALEYETAAEEFTAVVAARNATDAQRVEAIYTFEENLDEATGASVSWNLVGGTAEYVMGLAGLGVELNGATYLRVDGDVVTLHDSYTAMGAFITDAQSNQTILYQNHPVLGAPVRIRVAPANVTYSIIDTDDKTATTTVPVTTTDGQWHWFVARRTGSDNGLVTVDLWVDGQRSATSPAEF